MSKELLASQYLNLQTKKTPKPEGIDLEKMEKFARMLRGLIFATVEAGQSGHPGSSGKVEQFLAMTLSGILAVDPIQPKNPGRDRVIWSAGHCTPLLFAGNALYYEILRRLGRQFSEAAVKCILPEHLLRFRHADGPQGHAESSYPYSDFTSGPSGHGFAAAVGMAMVHQSCGLDTKTWVFMGDAESEEGMTYEARNLAATNGLKNLIISLDYNHFGIDADIEEVIASPYINHWLGLGWNVIEVDGHNVSQLVQAYQTAAKGFANNSPTVVLCHTLKGKGYGKLENTAASHGSPVKHDEYVKIMQELDFYIPGKLGEVMEDIETVLAELTREDEQYILERLEVSAKKILPERILLAQMKKTLGNRPFVNPLSIKRPKVLPPELVFKEGEKVSTRKAAQAWMSWFMKQTAFFYAGAGDLAKSVYTNSAEDVYGLINRDNPLGRGIRYGIAEQNMGMMGSGMTQDILPGGFRPVSIFGTFAVFTNMMVNSIRLPVIGNQLNPDLKGFFIALAAHDGPETGEDGPTHQGMYWMATYAALPGIKVYKPLDANETIEMLFYALEKGEPIILSLYRPEMPVLVRKNGMPAAIEATHGAYVYKPFSKDSILDNVTISPPAGGGVRGGGSKKVVLAICGSQILQNTLEILPELEKQNWDVKIIVVTSPELFEELRKKDPSRAQSILPDEERSLVITLHNGWPGFLYPFMLPADYTDRAIGINRYLKSGNVKEVYDLAQMNPQDIKEKILKTAEN